MGSLTRRLPAQDGATAVEYGIMVAMIAIVIFVAVFAVGQSLRSDFDCVASHVENTPHDPSLVTCATS